MTATRALAWKETRQVLPNVAALAVLGLTPVLAVGLTALSGRTQPEVGTLTLAFVVLPAIALVLGATLCAGDGAWEFMRSRPVSAWRLVAVRLGVRLAALVLLVAVSSAIPLLLRWHESLRGENVLVACLLSIWPACWFGASALVSGFVQRPLQAVFGGLAVATALAGMMFAALRSASPGGDLPWMGVAGGAMLLLFGAALAAHRRVSEASTSLAREGRLLARFAGWTAAVGAVLFLLWFVSTSLMARRTERDADAAWAATGATLDGVPARHAPVTTNDSAHAVEALAARLDMDVVPKPHAALAAPTDLAASARFQPVRPHLHAWLSAALSDPGPSAAPGPDDVAAYLAAHESDLDDLRRHLSSAAMPRWAEDLRHLYMSPLPNLLGLLDLARVLHADALRAEAGGRHDVAMADEDAALRLAISLEDRPELISQLIAIVIERQGAAVVRKLGDASPAWRDHLRDDETSRRVAESFLVDAWIRRQAIERDVLARVRSGGEGGGGPWHLPWRVVKPMILLLETRDEVRRADLLRQFEARGTCGPDSVLGGWQPEAATRQSILTRPSPDSPSYVSAWARVGRLDLERELTLRVLDLKALRATDPEHRWPAHPDGIETSRCGGAPWAYSVAPDGTMTLAYAGDVHPPDDGSTFSVPLRYMDGPAAGPGQPP